MRRPDGPAPGRRRHGGWLPLLVAGTIACRAVEPERTPDAEPTAPGTEVLFRDLTEQAGLDFVHENGGTGRRYLPEIMGSGGCAIDYDGDGWLDLYLVQSGAFEREEESGDRASNRLYRNLGDGTFAEVTAEAGVGDEGYGMGAVAADYDNDGDSDLLVVNYGADILLRNVGDGTFVDVTRQVGLASQLWGSSATFFDADLDGRLDLYVVNYLDFSPDSHVDCGRPSQGILSYCSPDVYAMAPDVYFHQGEDGSFVDATLDAGLLDRTGKGLGVVAADLTGDRWPDLYVANDSTPNFLYRNRGDGSFEEAGILLGVSHNENGQTEAGMGTDAGDVDGDGYLDIFVTNLSRETNSLYLGGPDFFTYHTRRARLFDGSYLPVGFGTDLLDLDNDGDLDILVTNGHVIDNVELIDDALSFRQPSQVFLNDGRGRFQELDPGTAGDVAVPRVGRATVTFDFDRDGRLDVAIAYNDDRARLFHNRLAGSGHWIALELRSASGNREGVGARVAVETGRGATTDEMKTGSSYQSSGQPTLHFGLGEEEQVARLRLRWPGGREQVFVGLRGDRFYRVVEPAARDARRRTE